MVVKEHLTCFAPLYEEVMSELVGQVLASDLAEEPAPVGKPVTGLGFTVYSAVLVGRDPKPRHERDKGS